MPFTTLRLSDRVSLIQETGVANFLRCNIWHVRGRDRDLMIDTGMGIASLTEAAKHLLTKPVTAVATHTHADHIGSHCEFEHCLVHKAEAANLATPTERGTLLYSDFTREDVIKIRVAGYEIDGDLITALPHAGYDLRSYRIHPARVTEIVEDGDVVETGDRRFEVLHLPGHSPGSMGLWEAASGTLFSGDALYDGPLLDELDEALLADGLSVRSRPMCAP